jgi:hypothetical protein
MNTYFPVLYYFESKRLNLPSAQEASYPLRTGRRGPLAAHQVRERIWGALSPRKRGTGNLVHDASSGFVSAQPDAMRRQMGVVVALSGVEGRRSAAQFSRRAASAVADRAQRNVLPGGLTRKPRNLPFGHPFPDGEGRFPLSYRQNLYSPPPPGEGWGEGSAPQKKRPTGVSGLPNPAICANPVGGTLLSRNHWLNPPSWTAQK